ncbi:uncharacterized mitochondrial protein AtMg00820-like [Humulus lupulus]|uniref:uncharacterized mitochondrial protein AtMg00820-like n=1 Tax=Humulus lupulus TaxID=3486 RepID=UPI002B418649|nr:uncharacterized mitochondrial protein AtMg00820-like [Humulus lupulus]
MESMYSNPIWTLEEPLEDVRHIDCKWIFKKKGEVDGKVETFKARLVAKGYAQQEGVDYEETFSPIAILKSIRILLPIVACMDYEIWKTDVKIAFLMAILTKLFICLNQVVTCTPLDTLILIFNQTEIVEN